jgi:hypothetical protein
MEDLVAKLDELAELKSAADVTRLDYEAKRAEILRNVQNELDALAVEYEPRLEAVNERIAELENEIKGAVLQHGSTVRGSRIYAVFYRGRISWDTKGLDRYAESHPEVVEFRKQGEPSVTLRIAKSGKQNLI